MGTHGVYVWGSFVVVMLVMIIEPVLLGRQRMALIARLKRQLRAERVNGVHE